jgi:hypothetical protein
MRILLLGELSDVHRELKPGLLALGHEVTSAHALGERPGYPSDLPLYVAGAGGGTRLSSFRQLASQVYWSRLYRGFDIVQIITPKFFHWRIQDAMLRGLKAHNGALIVVNTDCTAFYHRQVQKLRYNPCALCLEYDQKRATCHYVTAEEERASAKTLAAADAIVATHFEYDWALRGTEFAGKVVTLPLPIDTKSHPELPFPEADKVRIWYAGSRYGMKGGPFIEGALQRLREGPCGEAVDVRITARLPYAEYFETMKWAQIVIDNASGYGVGMNGMFAAARGRIVLGGAEAEQIASIGVGAGDNPIVMTRPEVDQIELALETLVRRRQSLPELGRRTADYVRRFHDSRVVARRYSRLYEAVLSGSVNQMAELGRAALKSLDEPSDR